jgi:hypothetical protein
MRRRLLDFRKSATPALLGSCGADGPRLCEMLNTSTERLIYAGGETGWLGGWYKTAFSVTRANPYVTTGREIARIVNFDVCSYPVKTQNEFYEFLEAGVGLQPQTACDTPCQTTITAYERGFYPSMVDIPTSSTFRLRVYAKDTQDYGKRVLCSGTDTNDVIIRNTDTTAHSTTQVQGEFLTLGTPFTDSIAVFKTLTGVQKDITFRDVDLYAVDTATGAETKLSTYAANETVPSYRRYFFNNLPLNCCCSNTGTITVTAMAKLEFIPVTTDTDFLLIGNLPALEEECLSTHYGRMDNPTSLQMAALKHKNAITLLNKELDHYFGRMRPAINQPLWGTARLSYKNIGSMV